MNTPRCQPPDFMMARIAEAWLEGQQGAYRPLRNPFEG